MTGELGAIFVTGRLRALSRAAVSGILVNQTARLVRDPAKARTVVVAHAAMRAALSADGRLTLPVRLADGARLLSETGFRHALGLETGAAPLGAYALEEVGRLAGLAVDTVEALALFDVIGAGQERFGYRDLATARQVASLMGQGRDLRMIVEAAWALAERGVGLSQVRLVAAPWGGMAQQMGPRLARLDGQFTFSLEEAGPDAEASLAQALASEDEGALAEAERWYRRAAQADRRDPIAAFNLGNVLEALGRHAEATIAFQQALAVDPAFAEAAFNLAGLHEKAGHEARALALYAATVDAHPAYGQALYNYARLLTLTRRFADALPLWERFIALAPGDGDASHARRAALLCRLELRGGAPRP